MNTVEHGPYPLQITNGLDFYKSTMSQVAYEQHPEATVTFTFKNRGSERLLNYIDIGNLQNRFNTIMHSGFSEPEIQYLASISGESGEQLFTNEYLDEISDKPLPAVMVTHDSQTDDINIEATGDWDMVTFWETVVMSEVNETYFENFVQKNNLNVFDVYDEGEKRLTDKIERLKSYPEIIIVDFGTRRHFSYRWQRHVVERLANELPNQLLGTSNIGLAKDLGLTPIGTFAHEMLMVYAALADAAGKPIRASHGEMLDDWFSIYGEQLSIALTDTFGSDFFFADFGTERAIAWKGVRHDSGDPFAFGEKVIAFFAEHGIDPTTKTIVFSDGLDIDSIIQLHNHFNGRIKYAFGWGTTLTNDLGLKPLNIVMKATQANGAPTVKNSDAHGKHTGDDATIERYSHEFSTRIAA